MAQVREPTLEALKARARAGDADAAYSVGFCYHPYTKTPAKVSLGYHDHGEAFLWYGRAAEKGHSKALHALGLMHEHGYGTPRDLERARSYFARANRQGYPCIVDIDRVSGAIAVERPMHAAAAAAAVAAAGAEEEEEEDNDNDNARAAENIRKQRALEHEAARVEQENGRVQRDKAALDTDKLRHQQQVARERAALEAQEARHREQVANDRAALDADKARHEQQVARDRAALEADRARLQQERDAFDAVRREQEAQHQAEEAAAAALIASQQEAAAAKQAEILADRHAEGTNYVPTRNAVAAAWEPTKVQLADCPVHAQPLTPGQSVLLSECLHTICRNCTPHMLQPDNSVQCPVCQAISRLDPNALPPHPFIEAELAAGEAHDCATCLNDPDEEGLKATDKCTTCNPHKLLCQHHAGLHRARQPTHTVTSLPNGGAAMRCQTHNEPIAAYCTGCRELICLACTLSTHQSHPARLLTDTAFVEGLRHRLVEGVAVARTVAEALIDHAADATMAVTEVDERDAAIASEIDRTVNVLAGILERRREVAHDQRLARTRDERTLLQTTREESEYHWRIITSAADLAEQLATGTLLGVNATAVMVQLEAAATARLHAVLELAPERGVPPPAILRFHSDESLAEQLTLLGEVVQDAP